MRNIISDLKAVGLCIGKKTSIEEAQIKTMATLIEGDEYDPSIRQLITDLNSAGYIVESQSDIDAEIMRSLGKAPAGSAGASEPVKGKKKAKKKAEKPAAKKPKWNKNADLTRIPGNPAHELYQIRGELESIVDNQPEEISAELLHSRLWNIFDWYSKEENGGGIDKKKAFAYKRMLDQAFETGRFSGMRSMEMRPHRGTAQLFVVYNFILPAIDRGLKVFKPGTPQFESLSREVKLLKERLAAIFGAQTTIKESRKTKRKTKVLKEAGRGHYLAPGDTELEFSLPSGVAPHIHEEWGVISAYDWEGRDEENRASHDNLIAMVKRMGNKYFEISGSSYSEVDGKFWPAPAALFIVNCERDAIQWLASELNQHIAISKDADSIAMITNYGRTVKNLNIDTPEYLDASDIEGVVKNYFDELTEFMPHRSGNYDLPPRPADWSPSRPAGIDDQIS